MITEKDTDEALKLMARAFAAVEWNPVEYGEADLAAAQASPLPYVTHEGSFEAGTINLRCYQLSDGRRIIDAEDLETLFFT